MIPKIVHNIWIQGYDQLPENIKKRYEDIKKLNPNWKFILWDDAKIKNLLVKYPKLLYSYNNCNLYRGTENCYPFKSDIARFVLLKEYGGLYYDLDFICVKSFDILFEKYDLDNTDYIFTSSSKINFLKYYFIYIYPFVDIPKYCACFIASPKNHPMWEKVFNIIENAKTKHNVGFSVDKILQTGKYKVQIIDNINGHYDCGNGDIICQTPTQSSWNKLRPILQFINCRFNTILFISTIFLIIILKFKYK